MSNIHNGHRSRIREKFEDHGLDTFNDHEVLEFILFYVQKRVNTNEIAHALINKFKNLKGVFAASISALESVPGVGHQSAVFLNLVGNLHTRILRTNIDLEERYDSLDLIGGFFVDVLKNEKSEAVSVMYFNSKAELLGTKLFRSSGTYASDTFERNILGGVFEYDARAVAIAHNHPRGIAAPSEADVSFTVKLKYILDAAGVTLVDHFVIADDEYYPINHRTLNKEVYKAANR